MKKIKAYKREEYDESFGACHPASEIINLLVTLLSIIILGKQLPNFSFSSLGSFEINSVR